MASLFTPKRLRRFGRIVSAFALLACAWSHAAAQDVDPIMSNMDARALAESVGVDAEGVNGATVLGRENLSDFFGDAGDTSDLTDRYYREDGPGSCSDDPSCIDPLEGVSGVSQEDIANAENWSDLYGSEDDPMELLGDIFSGNLLCTLGSEGESITSTTRYEYQCESGQTVETEESTCDLVLVHEVDEDYTYVCEVTTLEDGSVIPSNECEVLKSADGCELTGSSCTQTGGSQSTQVTCRIGPESVSGDTECPLELVHHLRVSLVYECAYVWDIETQSYKPDPQCSDLEDDDICRQTGEDCDPEDKADRDRETCDVGSVIDEETGGCTISVAAYVDEDYDYVSERRWDAETSEFVSDAVVQLGREQGCRIGGELCSEPTEGIRSTHECTIGETWDVRTETCVQEPDIELDWTYIYRASREWSALAADHVGSTPAWSALAASPSCSPGGASVCLEETPVEYEELNCLDGYRESYEEARCAARLEMEIDVDYVYHGRRSWVYPEVVGANGVSLPGHRVSDQLFNDAQAADDICAKTGPETCVKASVTEYAPLTCTKGYRDEATSVATDREWKVETATTYTYLGRLAWDEDANDGSGGFLPDTVQVTAEEAFCSSGESVCVEETSGGFDQYVCFEGHRVLYENKACRTPFRVESDGSWIYHSNRSWDRESETFLANGSHRALSSDDQCSLTSQTCVRPVDLVEETGICVAGTTVDYVERTATRHREVEVDEDYVYVATREWDGASHTPSSLHDALSSDETCSVHGAEVCTTPTPVSWDVLPVCQQGYREGISTRSCLTDLTVTARNVSVYKATETRSGDLWVASDALNALRSSACALVGDPICTSSIGTSGADTGWCLTRESTYQCIYEVEEAAPPVSSFQVDAGAPFDTRTARACPSVTGDATCVPDGEPVCVEGPETRNIDGVEYTRDCWAWEQSYTCDGEEHIDTCDVPAGYTLHAEASSCAWRDSDDICRLYNRVYRKLRPDPTNGCSEFTQTFHCEEADHGPPVEAVHEIVSNRFPYGESTALRADRCVRTAYEFSPRASRVVNGLTLNFPWELHETYSCPVSVPIDTCPASTYEAIRPDFGSLTNYPLGGADGMTPLSRHSNTSIVGGSLRVGPAAMWVSTRDVVAVSPGDRLRLSAMAAAAPGEPPAQRVRLSIFLLDDAYQQVSQHFQTYDLSQLEDGEELEHVVPTNSRATYARWAVLANHGANAAASLGRFDISSVVFSRVPETNRLPDLVPTSCKARDSEGACTAWEYHYTEYVQDASGGCHEWQDEFSCAVELPGVSTLVASPTGTASFSGSTGYDERSCGPYAGQDSCEVITEVCDDPEPVEPITVSGVTYTPSCLNRRVVYECSTREDFECSAPLPSDAVLNADLSECSWEDRSGECQLFRNVYEAPSHDPTGGCAIWEAPYTCHAPLEGLDPDETATTIVSQGFDDQDLVAEFGDREMVSCDFDSVKDVCKGGTETRVIDGLSITHDCWRAASYLQCEERLRTDTCQVPREAVPDPDNDACLWEDAEGVCRLQRYAYRVPLPSPADGCDILQQEFLCEETLGDHSVSDEHRHVIWNTERVDDSVCLQSLEGRNDCRLVDEVCSERGDKMVDGLLVSRPCWTFSRTYQCAEYDYIDTCDLPEDAEYVTTTCANEYDRDGKCTLFELEHRRQRPDPTGGCRVWEDEFVCGETVADAGEPFASSAEIGSVTWPDGSCTSEPDGFACQTTEQCVEGADTRTVEGLDVTLECWKREVVQTCRKSEAIDTCSGAVPHYATRIVNDCSESTDGRCHLWDRTYEWFDDDGSGGCHLYTTPLFCEYPLPSPAVPSDFHYTYADIAPVATSCPGIRAPPLCVETARTCADAAPSERVPSLLLTTGGEPFEPLGPGPETTAISDCWSWDVEYSCEQGEPVDECSALSEDSACEFVSSSCVEWSRSGDCARETSIYACDRSGSNGCTSKTARFVCDGTATSTDAQSDGGSGGYAPVDTVVEVVDRVWESQCTEQDLDPSCELVSEICSEPGQGTTAEAPRRAQDDYHDAYLSNASVIEDCFSKTRTYSCSASSDAPLCSTALDGQDQCVETASDCLLPLVDGSCPLREASYSCENARCEDSRYIVDPRKDDDRYRGFKYLCTHNTTWNGGSSSTCSGLAGCRGILLSTFRAVDVLDDGTDVTQTDSTYAYYCDSEVDTPGGASALGWVDGEGLDATSSDHSSAPGSCTKVSDVCVNGLVTEVDMRIGDGATLELCEGDTRSVYNCDQGDTDTCSSSCERWEDTYTCEEEVHGAGDPVTTAGTVRSHIDDSACEALEASENCWAGEQVCVEGPETRVIQGVAIEAECWRWERPYTCEHRGDYHSNCDVPAECEFVEDVCLSYNDDGSCASTEHRYSCAETEEVVLTEAVSGTCEPEGEGGDDDAVDERTGSGFSDMLSALTGMGEGAEDHRSTSDDPDLFGGEESKCSKWLVGTKNCCKRKGLLIGLGCSEEENKLKVNREADRCIFVGSYCSSKAVLGACLKKKESYCCYQSAISKLIAEAGHDQLGLDFGSAKEPKCDGFSVAQLQSLDLSGVDFSSVADDMIQELTGSTDSLEDAIRRDIDDFTTNGLPTGNTQGGGQ